MYIFTLLLIWVTSGFLTYFLFLLFPYVTLDKDDTVNFLQEQMRSAGITHELFVAVCFIGGTALFIIALITFIQLIATSLWFLIKNLFN